MMANDYEPYAREQTTVRPDRGFILWCPFCDDWRLTDSMVARKKLGQHMVNKHDSEVRFEVGSRPPVLEDF